MVEVELPELGENIDTVEVATVLVSKGDRVRRDQPLIEVETEKASLEIPSTVDGRIAEILVKAGESIRVGQVLLRLEEGAAESSAPSSADDGGEERQDEDREEPEKEEEETEGEAEEKEEQQREEEPKREERPEERKREVLEFPASQARSESDIGPAVAAAPSTRRLARELGVRIADVRGTGPGGRIGRDDVKRHAKGLIQGGAGAPRVAAVELPDFSRWGEIERKPLTAVRRATASGMARAWSTVPHVTQFDRADVTELESARRQFNLRPEAAGRKLTLTAIATKVVADALREFPKFNSSLDVDNEAMIEKKYVHVGIAVDTDRGLLVPVIRDADRKELTEVVAELDDLASRARAKKLKPDEMQGGSFTISNLGGLGTTYFTPIVNWPEVAILGVGRAEQQAVFEGSEVRPRLVLPLSVSYDHRLIDGAEAARFLRWVAQRLERPAPLGLED